MSAIPPESGPGDFPPEATKINPRTGQREAATHEDLRKAIYEQKHPPKPGTVKRKANGDAQHKPAFPLTWVDEAQLDLDRKALVKGLLDLGGFALIYGPSASGKSFFTADLAQQIATAQPWRGRKVTPGLVVYIAAEAGRSILQRFIGWRDNRMGEAAEQIPLAVITKGPSVLMKQDQVALAEQLRDLEIQCALPLVLVVFDTLSRSIPGGDENESRDMTEVIGFADYLRETFGTATAFVHHSGKDATRGARGHSALFAAADLVMLIDNHQATVEKCRDGVAGEKFPFALEPIDLGVDEDGDPIMTCLLSHTDESGIPTKRKPPTGRNQKLILSIALDLVAESGKPAPGTSAIPAGAKTITYTALVERTLPKLPGLEAFTARQRIAAATHSLRDAGFLGLHGDLVWLT